jgi:hypothetical protein
MLDTLKLSLGHLCLIEGSPVVRLVPTQWQWMIRPMSRPISLYLVCGWIFRSARATF